MPDVLSAIDRRWRLLAEGRHGQAVLCRWQQSEAVLARYQDLGQLGVAARGVSNAVIDLDGRDDLQRALYRLARTDADAQLAALWLVVPALRRAAASCVGVWNFDEAGAVAVSAALDRIVRFPHEGLRPAACTVRWVRRALGREAMFARRNRSEIRVFESGVDPIDDSLAHPADELLDLIDGALRHGYLRPSAAQLIIDHRLGGIPTTVRAAELGCPASTLRQRRNRAEAQLATWARQAA